MSLGSHKLVDSIIKKKIGIIGVGQMGDVLLNSFSNFLNNKYSGYYNIDFNDYFYLHDPFPGKKETYKKLGFKNFVDHEAEIFDNSKIVFACVKPDQISNVLLKSKSKVDKNSLVISIAAGISIEFIENLYSSNYILENGQNSNDYYNNNLNTTNTNINLNLNNRLNTITHSIDIPKIVRIMTNHLCSIGEAGSVYSMNKYCGVEEDELIHFLLKNMGLVHKIDEKLMNAFTALTGSGPAFVYHFIESLVDASLKNGIDVKTAREFAVQTVYAAAKYVNQTSDKNPNNIQYIVTTPNGTTTAGLNQLNKNCFKYAVSEAISAATVRGEEIEQSKLIALEKMKKSSYNNMVTEIPYIRGEEIEHSNIVGFEKMKKQV